MMKIDWENERKRLNGLYGGMSEGELQEVADDADSLTDVARETLRAEMMRRGMEAPPESRAIMEKPGSNRADPNPVLVGQYRDLPAAAVAKSLLDSAGIESFLVDDNLVRLDWLISNALGGIKLFVREEDSEAARELLQEGVSEEFDDPESDRLTK